MKLSNIFLFFGVVIALIFVDHRNDIVKSIAGVFLSIFTVPLFWNLINLFSKSGWKKSQNKLEDKGILTDNTLVRISFAYLFRIVVNNQYLLVKNERGTQKFQPVGGVYKFADCEKYFLKDEFSVIDDDRIPIDQSSRNDYRLRLKNQYLRHFVERFDTKAVRERVDDLSREFKEELVSKGVLNWKTLEYRYCGRHEAELKFSPHFGTYELLFADIVELIPTDEQQIDLARLMNDKSDLYCFVSSEKIQQLGVDYKKGQLQEVIADHSVKILQESESNLQKNSDVGKRFTVDLD